jgi:hypothetical protein
LAAVVLERHANPGSRADWKYVEHQADWQDACDWIAHHLPASARCLTPRQGHTFKWYTSRPEVVTRKDMPQDALGIVEWWRRMDEIHRYDDASERHFRSSLAELGDDLLVKLGREYRADYVVTTVDPPLGLELLYRNNTYVVYHIAARP